MAWQAAIPYVIAAVTSLFSGLSGKASAKADARQFRHRARLRLATGQRAAIEEKRQARYLMSTARARAAGGGGNLSDPTLVNIFADIEAGGEYNALSRLWDAGEEAAGDISASDARLREGQALATTGILKGAASFYDAYG